ncbi:MAG: hypothetical protein HC892_19680, partial [Saprospiraceae bacterium]|nr:hypothetical protein [Saprospiraceae bacterium]
EGSIDWVYDAVGNKLSKTVRQTNLVVNDNPIANGTYQANVITAAGTVAAGSEVTFIASDSVVLKAGFVGKPNFIAKTGNNEGETRHYVGGIEYFNGEMEAIYHEAGRVVFENSLPVYEYVLTDHLGNTRVVFKNLGGVASVVQESEYYPFGMEFEEGASGDYNYTYNGKESQTELGLKWLDFGARCLMVDNARWMQVDPSAERYYALNTFVALSNNPLLFIDPDGRDLVIARNEFTLLAISDIVSLVNSSQFDGEVKITFTESERGIEVGANFSNFSAETMEGNAGISLLSNVISSSNTYLYEVSTTFKADDRNSGESLGKTNLGTKGNPGLCWSQSINN